MPINIAVDTSPYLTAAETKSLLQEVRAKNNRWFMGGFKDCRSVHAVSRRKKRAKKRAKKSA
jgi:hypothetical protein